MSRIVVCLVVMWSVVRLPTAFASPPPQPWWCVSFNVDAVGGCKPSQAACEEMRTNMQSQIKPDEPIAACQPVEHAICLATRADAKAPLLGSCYPSFGNCRAHADFFTKNGTSVVQSCRPVPAPAPGSTDAATLAADEAARWWCVSITDGGDANRAFGACERTRARCEDDRAFPHRSGRSQLSASECTSQRSAFCISTENPSNGQKDLECLPTMSMCKYRSKQPVGVRIKSDCHAAE